MHIMEQKDDDTHLCLRCSKTIIGLENYITHRQQHCFSILTAQEPKEKCLPTDVPQPCVVAPLSSSPPQSSSWDVPLTASDFFSCLELQSTVSAPRTDISPGIPSQQFSCSPKTLRDNVLELPSTSSSVNCPPFDDVEECDQGFFSECETNSTEYFPPRTHTGGKWKPGSRPHLKNRQQWSIHSLQSAACDLEQNGAKCIVQNVQVCMSDYNVIDALNFECRPPTEKSPDAENVITCSDASVELQCHSLLKSKMNDSVDMLSTSTKCFPSQTFNCNYCNEICPDQLSYTFHLFSTEHKAQFLDTKDYHEDIFRHENLLIRTMLFQCRMCSFYWNDVEKFLSHMKSNEHSKNVGTKKKLICLPWRFHCDTSEEITRELLNSFKSSVSISHPVIILKNKIPLFCNFCVGTCRYQQNSKKSLRFLARKRIGYKNTLKRSSQNQRRLSKVCPICGRSFIIKEYKKHLKICRSRSSVDEEQEPKNATEKECYSINYRTQGSGSVTCNARSISEVVGSNVKSVTADSVPGDTSGEKECIIMAKSAGRGDINKLCDTDRSEELFSCSSCEKKFPHKMTLLKHRKLHVGKQVYNCLKCDFQAVKRSLLRRHEETHNNNRPRPFVCEICGSAQLYKWALVQHMRVHSQGTFKCNFDSCQHVCRTRSELVQHQRVHTNERPYYCNLCAYSGRTAHQLKKHQRTHTGERPFKCKNCSYSASLSHQLLRHMRVHTGSKPYKCPYCDYVCNNQENIRKHILKTKKHEGAKMYPCTFCSFGCNDFPEFQKHLLYSHKEHFPNGLKDVDSSFVAGLYKKDFPRSETMKDDDDTALRKL